MQVGFLGLGQMGSAIAERLQEAGIGLHVYDPHAAAMAPFVARGAIGHAGPEGVANEARIVFACLPNGAVSESVARDVALGASIRVYVEMSTIGSPALAKVQATVEAHGITLVDCPISGGPKGARAGTLTVIAAGPAWARDELRPLLHAVGGQVFEVGDKPGQAQLMKLVNNLVNAANMATAFEALVLGAKGGLDPDQMVSVLNVSTGQNSATLTKVPKAVLTGSFDYGAALATMVKDVVLGLSEAEALGVPMWVHQQVGALWRFGEQQGLGREDFTALIKVLEGWAGVTVRSRG
ncbi:NAD(P)-dependent oxidoreductase [Rhodopila sp.]|jgi:3-hydroxyisobutyrate dehydrogenase-like beta-hydroxyacid dehydrogenase|uniref:NAD(P)-dependent oxidoreductase n=1 Tax=Rhodopila sp. TaxID=2480087 RepID=UPI002CE89B63|nr:NAD(P)-dependent oxidoreductase [Rhodopila sp.]HVZ10385.1 NAD(P)-dependent oxidoreductase [Rhodopila sp.]